MEIWLRYDLRSPSFGTPTPRIIAALLEQVAWADSRGLDAVQFPEHHGMGDSYNPSPLPLVGAVAARTEHLRLHPTLIFPFYDPVRLAEDCCVLDNISGGRLDITVALGYVPHEFEMYGLSLGDRGHLVEQRLAVLRTVFDDGRFEFDGRKGRVTPRALQAGGPPLYIGGSLKATARRAARYGDGYYPLNPADEYINEYLKACADLGKAPGKILKPSPVLFFHVTEDPEADWARIAPHALHEANSYAEAAKATNMQTPFIGADTPEALRRIGAYRTMTPSECIEYCRGEAAAGRYITIVPMMGGLAPELGWSSLELFVNKVLPEIREDQPKK